MKKKNNRSITVNRDFEKDQHLTDPTVIKVTLDESTGEQNGVVVLAIHPAHGLQMDGDMRSGGCHETDSGQGRQRKALELLSVAIMSCIVQWNCQGLRSKKMSC